MRADQMGIRGCIEIAEGAPHSSTMRSRVVHAKASAPARFWTFQKALRRSAVYVSSRLSAGLSTGVFKNGIRGFRRDRQAGFRIPYIFCVCIEYGSRFTITDQFAMM